MMISGRCFSSTIRASSMPSDGLSGTVRQSKIRTPDIKNFACKLQLSSSHLMSSVTVFGLFSFDSILHFSQTKFASFQVIFVLFLFDGLCLK